MEDTAVALSGSVEESHDVVAEDEAKHEAALAREAENEAQQDEGALADDGWVADDAGVVRWNGGVKSPEELTGTDDEADAGWVASQNAYGSSDDAGVVESPEFADTGAEQDVAKTDREEQLEREAKEAEARAHLSKPSGGIIPTKAELQATGGSKEIRPDAMPRKDDRMRIVTEGWVKQIQDVTVKQDGNAKRVAVFVVDEIVSMERIERPQLALGEEE